MKTNNIHHAVIVNPHFWGVLVIILGLGVIYYSQNFVGAERIEWLWRLGMFEYKFRLTGFLLFIPVIYAAVVFDWRKGIIAWSICMAIILPRVVYYASSPVSLIGNVLFLTVPVLVVLLFKLFSTWRKKEREILVEKEAQYRAYMSAVYKVQEDERKRIAQGLHDDTVQTLLVIANRVQSVLRDAEKEMVPGIAQQLGAIRDMMLEVTRDVRNLSLDLRPSILDDLGLTTALRRLVDNLNEDSISSRIVFTGTARKLPVETEIILYRFAQEAISNVRRHAEATQMLLAFRFGQETVRIEINDNGKGFIVPKDNMAFAAQGKFGIIGMQEKAKILQGMFNVFSERGKGSAVSLEIKA